MDVELLELNQERQLLIPSHSPIPVGQLALNAQQRQKIKSGGRRAEAVCAQPWEPDCGFRAGSVPPA